MEKHFLTYGLTLLLTISIPLAMCAQNWEAALNRHASFIAQVQKRAKVPELIFEKKYTQPPNTIPAWEVEELPFFCKIEHKLYKKVRIPVLFRLGSVEYVNQLEQKPGYGH